MSTRAQAVTRGGPPRGFAPGSPGPGDAAGERRPDQQAQASAYLPSILSAAPISPVLFSPVLFSTGLFSTGRSWPGWRPLLTGVTAVYSFCIGVVFLLPSHWGWICRVLVGWNGAIFVLVPFTYLWMRKLDAKALRAKYVEEDPTGPVILLVTVVGALLSVLGIIALLSTAKQVPSGAPSGPLTTSTILIWYFCANSKSRSSWAGTAMIAPVP